MTTYQNNIALLTEALGDKPTTTQELLVWINSRYDNIEYPLAKFLKENKIDITVSVFRLSQFKEELYHFWDTLNLEEKEGFKKNTDRLYSECAKWCKKMEEMRD